MLYDVVQNVRHEGVIVLGRDLGASDALGLYNTSVRCKYANIEEALDAQRVRSRYGVDFHWGIEIVVH